MTESSDSVVKIVNHEMPVDFEEQPIKRQRPVPSHNHALSDPELPCHHQQIHGYSNVPEDAVPMDISEETTTKTPVSLKPREKSEQPPHANVDDTMEVDESYPLQQLEPEKPSLRHVTRHVKNSLGAFPVLSPTKTSLHSPFLGPVGWTVPPKMSAKKSKPFLIYQDPETFDPTSAFPSARPNLNAFVSDENKENELILSDTVSSPFYPTEGDNAVIAPDNVNTGAANIISLAQAFNPEDLHRPQSQGYLMQIDDDKSDIDVPNNMALTRRRQRTDPVMAIAAHPHYF
ncbi:hypothetical protein KEM54_002888 [Ascosphaera aggregata]|nr:hypothetical protein KEM54_002888 [Ascosphaera aggregata]